MKCMLLAAGLGTRLRPITNSIPKPVVSLLNVPLFYYSIELLQSVQLSELIVNAHQQPEKVENLVKKTKLPYRMSLEVKKPLGSGGGIKHAEKYFDDASFLVLNADNVVLPNTFALIKNL